MVLASIAFIVYFFTSCVYERNPPFLLPNFWPGCLYSGMFSVPAEELLWVALAEFLDSCKFFKIVFTMTLSNK